MLAIFSIRDTILPKEILGNIFCVYECMCMYLQRSQIEIVVFCIAKIGSRGFILKMDLAECLLYGSLDGKRVLKETCGMK